jgi:ribose transport system ATP-binding protein
VSTPAAATPLLEAAQISKAFPGVQALQGVNLRLAAGEVLAVVGENGAGKSTLMKILGGVHPPDGGTIRLDGHAVRLDSVNQAQERGIVLIHQELNLAENLDVAGNIFLGREPTFAGGLKLLARRVYPQAETIMRRIGLDCSPRTLVSQLTVGRQQLVEIARALSLRSRVIIMDEPTSSLTQRETERLFAVIRDLKRDGVSLLYISHRLKEVEEIADRVTVLRDGRNAGELDRAEIKHDAIVRLMVGRELKQFYHREHQAVGSVVLSVKELRWSSKQTQPIDLAIRAGEIVGMAGLMGAGRTELAETLFGVRRRVSGELRLNDRAMNIDSPAQAIAAGIFLIPEDRRIEGLVLTASLKHNISLGSLDRLQRLRLVTFARERELSRAMCHKLNIRTPGIGQTVGLLSGGNQQKVVLAKWLARAPLLLILDEPTRGVDVGAKAEIYGLMDQLAGQGVAILMISSDLEEILGMSDRVLVMHEGRLAGEVTRAAMTEEAIMRLATGGKVQP